MKNQRGQVLLIIILLATVLLTIGLSVSQITTQETQIAKLEEESKKAFAAAEAGLDQALKGAPIGGSIPIIFEGVTGTAVVESTQGRTFLTPLLKKDGQYTFYLSQYDPLAKQIIGVPSSANLTIKLNQPTDRCTSQNQLAVELTFINSSDSTISRRLIDPCPIIAETSNEWSFDLSYSPPAPSHLLILRIIAPEASFPGAKLEIVNNSEANWPLQGKTVTSQATTTTGVSKKIQLFQSYPQIPADFFVTSF